MESPLRNAAVGPYDDSWLTPSWLLQHQVEAARRIKAIIEIFRGALLADSVGLGKTYVALAVASHYPRTTVVLPAALASQWNRVSALVGVGIRTVTHEALSRRAAIPPSDLIVVDEAHRFRNPNTRRYERLSCGVKNASLLLLTATPVVNRPSDLVRLLRLFCHDSAFSVLGMESIEITTSKRDFALLARTAASAVVARSGETINGLCGVLPRVRDGRVIRAYSIDRRTFPSLLELVDALRFPGSAVSQERELLRLHLLHRLASSGAAFRESVRRHLAYTDRAIDAVERGGSLSRSLARRIFNDEVELQLALGDVAEPSGDREVKPAELHADRSLLTDLLIRLSGARGSNPKARKVKQILKQRSGHKTIVFTTAVATALEIARVLDWSEVAVVGSGFGWIASGRISVDEALALFAPIARCRSAPPRSMRVSSLIATDLASEGLDLQDADAVVHYDLPWTPLKLEQRVGRIARLGSKFRTSDVYWFAPPHALDRRLRLESRISQKVCDQIGLHVPSTSKVGRAHIVNKALNERERLGRTTGRQEEKGPRFAVVTGNCEAVIAVRWLNAVSCLPELITLSGTPLYQVSDFASVEKVLSRLLTAPASEAAPPKTLFDCLLKILRNRLASADLGETSQTSRRLARRVLSKAREAGKRREPGLLATLDGVLDRLRQGVNAGGERRLIEVLSDRSSNDQLAGWLNEQPVTTNGRPAFEIIAALFGDGSAAID